MPVITVDPAGRTYRFANIFELEEHRSMAVKLNIKVGNVYKVKDNRAGSSFYVGEEVKVMGQAPGGAGRSYMNYGGLWSVQGASHNCMGVNGALYGTDLDVGKASREERLNENLEEIYTSEKRIVELKAANERLVKFKTDEEETAFLLVTASDGAKSPEERVAAIAKILKDRSDASENTQYL